jgi:hypothetical protein
VLGPLTDSVEAYHNLDVVAHRSFSNLTIFDINKFTGAISVNVGALAAGVFDYERQKSLNDASNPD